MTRKELICRKTKQPTNQRRDHKAEHLVHYISCKKICLTYHPTQKIAVNQDLPMSADPIGYLDSSVTYWPSTELSMKRCTCVNKQKNSETGTSGRRYRNITLTCGRGWIRWWWQMRTPRGSSWVSNKNITRCHRRLESVRVPVVVGNSWGQDASVRTACRLRALGPQWPMVELPIQNAEEVLLWSEELWVNM